jgi:tripartite-type tricarboxylate transporter receptor subunit TctC
MRHLLKAWLLAGMALSGAVAAAEFPVAGKPITIINPYPPGGLGDILARAVAKNLSETLGTPVIVDSKPGANGSIGTTFVARAQPDGYTLGSVPMSTLAINPVIYKGLAYQPMKDLTPITQAVTFANVLVASNELPVNNLAELAQYLKTNSAAVNYGSQGNGSSGHLEGALLNLAAGAQMTHVPYAGSGPAMQALLSGSIQLMFETVPAAVPLIKAGRIKALGVASNTPMAQAPGVPPISSVIKGFEATNWIGIIGPAGLPPEVLAKLNEHLVRALRSPEVMKLAEERGITVVAGKPEELAQVIANDTRKWSDVVREAKIRND